jgi:hypothetical protein
MGITYSLFWVIFGSSLITLGLVFAVYSFRVMWLNNYKPRNTRSTYLPPKR